jgi:Alw26I/Eco31I/Esp3I family type II restriction endonuclease
MKLLRKNNMARQKREWNPEFIQYMDFIVKHPNYKDMPEPYKTDGTIRWVVSGNSDLGIERAKWWDIRVKNMHLPNRAEVARAVHPKDLHGLKPCQICGKKLSIYYVYPTKNTIKSLEKNTTIVFQPYDKDIIQIFDLVKEKINDDVFKVFIKIFKIPNNIEKTKDSQIKYVLEHCKTKLSPGVMSNPPDRFEGFHTYNACCRSKEDTGRHSSNLARYSQDRRAYENWAEGNWNLSNRLMGEFGRFKESVICPACGNKRKMTADHIGPISLGFTHRPHFNPLCSPCNSGKNNRITLSDVKQLLSEENDGDKVISWHSKFIWDQLKNKITTEEDALKLSKAMRLNMHNVLSLFSVIKEAGHSDFLISMLHPNYSFYDYKFENFHPLKLNELKILKSELDSKNKRKNAERYVRISLESLDDYKDKDNRKVKDFSSEIINEAIEDLLKSFGNKEKKEIQEKLFKVIELLSKESISAFF